MNAVNEKKLRHSAVRDRIYEYLLSTREHPSAETVYSELKAYYPELSLGTVYRNLKQLEQMGRIVRVAVVNDKERYDAFCDEHVHFVCNSCGKVLDFKCSEFPILPHFKDFSEGFQVERVGVVLSGYCNKCKI